MSTPMVSKPRAAMVAAMQAPSLPRPKTETFCNVFILRIEFLSVAVAGVGSNLLSRFGRVSLHSDAGTDEVTIAEDVVDAADGGPEFMLAQPGGRVGGLFARVGPIPLVG